ncbi:MAG: glycosyltransferase [Gemmatimonadaceae bacterium]
MEERSRMSLVTVVIPTHNRSALLARTLASALAQRGVELRAIVVDDGSTDDTPRVVERLADPRVTLIRNARSLGVSAARNLGAAAATSEWVAFLDDDDLWAPEKLAKQLGAAERDGRRWACCGTVTVTPDLRIVAGGAPHAAADIVAQLPVRNMIPAGASNVIARRDALADAGPFDTGLRHMGDWDLWIRLSRLGPPAVVAEPLLAYRLHDGNASADTATIASEMAIIEERYAALRAGAAIDRAYVYRWAAWNALRVGRRGAALRAYARAAASGDALSLGRAMVALAAPGIARRSLRRHRDTSAWEASAAAWLGPPGAA